MLHLAESADGGQGTVSRRRADHLEPAHPPNLQPPGHHNGMQQHIAGVESMSADAATSDDGMH